MSAENEKVAKWFRFKLSEAVKKQEPLYKEKDEKKAVMKDEENDVHNGISDFLLRVLSKDDIKKLNYINGFNPEPEIRSQVIPNPKKEKIKESVLTEDEGEAEDPANAADAEEQRPVTDVEDETNVPVDTGDAEPVNDVENNVASETSSEEDADANSEEVNKDKGVGAFDRVLEKCDKVEILSKAIAAVNAPDIAAARDLFYEWFDSYDDEHMSDDIPREDEKIVSDAEDGDVDEEEPVEGNKAEDVENEGSAEEPANEGEAAPEENKEDELKVDELFA